jgi:hypothetical protein
MCQTRLFLATARRHQRFFLVVFSSETAQAHAERRDATGKHYELKGEERYYQLKPE